MARKPQPLPQPVNDAGEAPKAPLVSPAPVAPTKPTGPAIEYFGEGAEKVQFTVNPKAVLYKVYADGVVVEYL